MEELSNIDLENAHVNKQLNEMVSMEPITYAYTIYLRGDTYAGINKNGDYYSIKYDNMRPEEAIKRMKFKSLITQYNKNLTNKDRKELDKCHKFIAQITMDIGISPHIINGSNSRK